VPYNVALSQRRADTVRRYLVQRGIDMPRIHWIGLGPLADGGLENAKKRRVTLRLMMDVN
jgi:outer membrane protein OmpA-like peptidoglycan-associated protein